MPGIRDDLSSSIQQRGEQGPISREQPNLPELPLQHSELVAQREDLEVFVALLMGSRRFPSPYYLIWACRMRS